MNKQSKEPLKCNCINKSNCPLRGKCQYESVVYKVEIYCGHNVIENNNKKKCLLDLLKILKKQDFIAINVVSLMRHKNSTSLLKYIWQIKKKLGIDPILKWEIIKKKML